MDCKLKMLTQTNQQFSSMGYPVAILIYVDS